MTTIDITDMSDAELDALLGAAAPECKMCGAETAHVDLLCVPCAQDRPDESYLSWGDHDPSYDY